MPPHILPLLSLALVCLPLASIHADQGHITGIGGVFVRSPNPKKLAEWYQNTLGIHLESWGGAMLPTDAPAHPPVVTWNAFPERTNYFAPSTRDFMLNFGVDNLDAFLVKLKAKGVVILKEEGDANGRFAWIVDPDGTKIEFWETKKP